MDNYKKQTTTIWSFPDRGNWATHNGNYRGNWSPHVPRNLILQYSNENDTVLDLFLGGGTTLVETKLLGRNGIGIDINPKAIELSKKALLCDSPFSTKQIVLNEDARHTSIKDNSIDFICMHPPYADIIKYSDGIKEDLSMLNVDNFLIEWDKIAKECKRLLKPGKKCAFMIGDCRKHGNIIPLGFKSMEVFIKNGFTIKEIIIKEQHNCKSTPYWENKSKYLGFYLLAHEYIFVFNN